MVSAEVRAHRPLTYFSPQFPPHLRHVLPFLHILRPDREICSTVSRIHSLWNIFRTQYCPATSSPHRMLSFSVADTSRDIHSEDDLKRQRNQYAGDQPYSNVSDCPRLRAAAITEKRRRTFKRFSFIPTLNSSGRANGVLRTNRKCSPSWDRRTLLAALEVEMRPFITTAITMAFQRQMADRPNRFCTIA